MSIFEALMMLGFGLAWPFNIYKSAVSKTAAGKSFLFTITIALAYLCGGNRPFAYDTQPPAGYAAKRQPFLLLCFHKRGSLCLNAPLVLFRSVFKTKQILV